MTEKIKNHSNYQKQPDEYFDYCIKVYGDFFDRYNLRITIVEMVDSYYIEVRDIDIPTRLFQADSLELFYQKAWRLNALIDYLVETKGTDVEEAFYHCLSNNDMFEVIEEDIAEVLGLIDSLNIKATITTAQSKAKMNL